MLIRLLVRVLLLVSLNLYVGCSTFVEQKTSITKQAEQSPSLLCHTIVDEKKKPTPVLEQVLALTGILYDGTCHGLVEQTQKRWLRPLSKERWQVTDVFADKREQLLPLFDKMGMVQALKPHYHHYDYALLLGANVPAMRARLAYLIELWQEGIRFDRLVFLVGARTLDSAVESDAIVLNLNKNQSHVRPDWRLVGSKPSTEAQAARVVYDQVVMPMELKQVPVTFIDTPMQRQGLIFKRPNTADTLIAWLKTMPKPGLCLIVSSQPFAVYQESVASSVLPASFTLDTVGFAASNDCSVAIYLDTLARVLFTQGKH